MNLLIKYNDRELVILAQKFLPFFVLLLSFILAGILVPDFIGLRNIVTLLYSAAVLMPAVIGMQILMIMGRFDLSIGSIAALAGMSTGYLLVQSQLTFIGIFFGIFVGGIIGCVNGILVSALQFDVLVATIATMGITRSMALGLFGGRTISGFPENFGILTQYQFLGISLPMLYVIVLVVFAHVFFRRSIPCRHFYAVGSNELAARTAGINTKKSVLLGFIFAGLGSSFTGVIQASRAMAASPLVFQDLPLETITACLLGGGNLRGGRGSILGACFGLLLVVTARNLVVALNGSVYWRYAINGILILLAVGIDNLARSK